MEAIERKMSMRRIYSELKKRIYTADESEVTGIKLTKSYSLMQRMLNPYNTFFGISHDTFCETNKQEIPEISDSL